MNLLKEVEEEEEEEEEEDDGYKLNEEECRILHAQYNKLQKLLKGPELIDIKRIVKYLILNGYFEARRDGSMVCFCFNRSLIPTWWCKTSKYDSKIICFRNEILDVFIQYTKPLFNIDKSWGDGPSRLDHQSNFRVKICDIKLGIIF